MGEVSWDGIDSGAASYEYVRQSDLYNASINADSALTGNGEHFTDAGPGGVC
jgi:hypothetical protein